MVDHAAERSIDIIPVVSALGHMEHFLRHESLQHLSELAGCETDRFFTTGFHHNICPSNEEAIAFIRTYLGEVAALFPSSYFHAGFDEDFDIGWCPRCRERVRELGSADRLLGEHIATVRGILAEHGKTMMMWDDLFELWPGALERAPRDVVMCTWCYDYLVHRPTGHFAHHPRIDRFAEYDRLGQPYMPCTYTWNVPNVASFTRYASFHKPLGALVTNWERRVTFNHVGYPVFDFAAKLWTSPDPRHADVDELANAVADDLAPDIAPDGRRAFIEFYHAPVKGFYYPDRADRFYGELMPVEHQRGRAMADIAARLEPACKGNDVIEDMAVTLRERLVRYRIRTWMMEHLWASLADRDWPDRKPVQREIEAVKKRRLAQWARHREGMDDKAVREHFKSMTDNLKTLATRIDKSTYFLMLRLFLPDRYSLPKLDVTIVDDHGGELSLLECETLKPMFDETPYFEIVVPYNAPHYPAAIRLEGYGFGGQGLAHVRILGKGKRRGHVVRWMPEAVRRIDGVVKDPTHCFADNLQWTWLGEHDTPRSFAYDEHSRMRHTMEVAVERKE